MPRSNTSERLEDAINQQVALSFIMGKFVCEASTVGQIADPRILSGLSSLENLVSTNLIELFDEIQGGAQ